MKQHHASPLTHRLTLALLAAGLATLSACSKKEEPPFVPAPATQTIGNEIDDTVVTGKVKAALLGDEQVKALEVKVETRKGAVLLSGFVDNQALLDRVLMVTRAVEGVQSVDNSMLVKSGTTSMGNQVDDTMITTKVKAALVGDPAIKSLSISTVTSKGRVQLSGFVDNQSQMDRAVSVARSVEGVQDVMNDMMVKK